MSTFTEDLEAGLTGAGVGVAATGVMSAVMVAARESGLMGELPPHEIARESIGRTELHDDVSRAEEKTLGWVLHFAFGAIAGALFALARRRLSLPATAAVQGVLFALGIWTVSYLGWVPAMRFLPPATKDRPGRPAAMIAAHVVFGAVLGSLLGRVRRTD